MKYYDRNRRWVIQTGRSATAQFWDDKWHDDQIGTYRPDAVRPFIDLTAAYLQRGARILEGGCGTAGKVAALINAGYAVTGVDFANDTVQRIKRLRPDFNVQVGDVFSLPFADSSFDGYWSFGVIEHFWGGYDGLLSEAWRVLNAEGYMFLTFPGVSPLRRLKAWLHLYHPWQGGGEPAGFYQFLLDPESVRSALHKHGFEVVHLSRIQAGSGAKQELKLAWKLTSILARAVPEVITQRAARGFESIFAPTVGHLGLIAARKRR